MTKLTKLSLIAALSLGTVANAGVISDGLHATKADGEVRAMALKTKPSTGASTTNYGIGGNVGFTTGDMAGFTIGTRFYMDANNGVGDDDLDTVEGIVGQAFIQYKAGNTMIKIGRQQLDTPLAGSDDIRLIPNLFEAALLVNTDISNTTLIGAHVTRMFGNDANNGDKFDAMSAQAASSVGADLTTISALNVSDKGTNVAAIVYAGLTDTTVQAWYYNSPDVLDAIYTDVSYGSKIGAMDLNFGAQYYTFSEDSNIKDAGYVVDYDVKGIMASLSAAGITGTLAYNTLNNNVTAGKTNVTVSGAWGGYPEYAFADEFWMSSVAGVDLDVTKVALEYDAGFATFGAAVVDFDAPVGTADVKVTDITAAWDCKLVKGVALNAVYEDQDSDTNANDKKIYKLRAAYAF